MKTEKAKAPQTFELAKVKVQNLPELQGWKDRAKKVIKENPFIKIEDSKSYESAKKSRTNLVKFRTEFQGQDKLIASTLRNIRKQAGEFMEGVLSETKPKEETQQIEVTRYENIKAVEAEEKRLKEEARKKEIQDGINEIFNTYSESLEEAKFADLKRLNSEFEYLETADREDFEDFEWLYLDKLDGARLQLQKTEARLEKEEADRTERERLEVQNTRLTALLPVNKHGADVDMATLWALSETEFGIILEKKIALAQDAIDAETKQKAEEAKTKAAADKKQAAQDAELKELREMKAQNEAAAAKREADEKAKEQALLAKEKANEDKKAAILAEAEEAEAKEKAEARAEIEAKAIKAAEAKRLKALQPDKAKLLSFLASLKFTEGSPENLKSTEAKDLLEDFIVNISTVESNFMNDINDLK